MKTLQVYKNKMPAAIRCGSNYKISSIEIIKEQIMLYKAA